MQDKNRQFEELMKKFVSGSITDEDKFSLFALIDESDVHRKQYDEIVKLYALLHVPAFESRKKTEYACLKKRLYLSSRGISRHNRFIYVRNIAAVVLLMITVSAGSIFTYNKLDKSGDRLYNETRVPLGSQTKILLPDGSTAVLNSGSVLKYPLSYGEKERNVYLTGEGYFEVANDKEKVFQVYAGDMKVKVTGTEFNLRCYLEDPLTEISLIKGGVDVSVGNKHIDLKHDEKAIYNRKTGDLHSEAVDSYKSALWTTGRLSFVNASFINILKDIERKYNIKIHVESRKVANEYFSGSIDLNMSLQEVFNFIDVDKKYRFEQSGNVILLKDR